MDEITILQILRRIVFWSSPVIFFVGVLLVLYANYRNIEVALSKEIGGIRKKIVPKLETNIYSFQEFLLQKNTVVGLICVVSAMVIFFTMR